MLLLPLADSPASFLATGAEKKLVEMKQQLKATRPGPVQNRTRERARQMLQQKKMWEKQLAQVPPRTANEKCQKRQREKSPG